MKNSVEFETEKKKWLSSGGNSAKHISQITNGFIPQKKHLPKQMLFSMYRAAEKGYHLKILMLHNTTAPL